MKVSKGFTLVELIIVIAIIAILAGAIFVAVDPARRLHEARNSRRLSDINSILDAIKKYQVDNSGDHYSNIGTLDDGDYFMIGTGGSSCDVSCITESPTPDCVDLSGIGSNYLATVPRDPKDGTAAITGYLIARDPNNAITILACNPEGEAAGGGGVPPTISVTR